MVLSNLNIHSYPRIIVSPSQTGIECVVHKNSRAGIYLKKCSSFSCELFFFNTSSSFCLLCYKEKLPRDIFIKINICFCWTWILNVISKAWTSTHEFLTQCSANFIGGAFGIEWSAAKELFLKGPTISSSRFEFPHLKKNMENFL